MAVPFIETPASILFLAVSVSFGDITSAADSFSDGLTAFLPLAHHLATPSQVSVPMTPIVCHQAPDDTSPGIGLAGRYIRYFYRRRQMRCLARC